MHAPRRTPARRVADADWGSEMKREIVMCTFALAAIMEPSGGPTVAEARSRQVDAGESQVQANGITIAYRSYRSANREKSGWRLKTCRAARCAHHAYSRALDTSLALPATLCNAGGCLNRATRPRPHRREQNGLHHGLLDLQIPWTSAASTPVPTPHPMGRMSRREAPAV